MAKKICRVCEIPKDESEFYAGQGNTCKKCNNERTRARRRQDPLRWRATRKAWERGNADRAVTRRKHRLKKRYKLSLSRVLEMLEEQDRRCLICNFPITIPGDPKPIPDATPAVVDHSHKDGHVRGLLCTACNAGLGMFDDNLRILRAAFYYLKNDLTKRKNIHRE